MVRGQVSEQRVWKSSKGRGCSGKVDFLSLGRGPAKAGFDSLPYPNFLNEKICQCVNFGYHLAIFFHGPTSPASRMKCLHFNQSDS